MEIISRFLKVGKQGFFLLGLRGTGKTTLIKNTFPAISRSFALDNPFHLLGIYHAPVKGGF